MTNTRTDAPTGPTPRGRLEDWWHGGQRIALPIGPRGETPQVLCRVDGHAGPWLVMIHGFPTCSFDWAELVPELSRSCRVLTFDLIGYGRSDKPAGLAYCTELHADTVEALLQHFDIRSAELVAHDIGTAVAQELLCRHDAQRMRARLDGITFLNGVVFVDHYQPRLLQRLLSNPVIGPVMSALNDEKIFARSFRRAFAEEHLPDDATCHLYYQAMRERGGQKQLHRLAYYVKERLREGPRWQAALVATRVPLHFVWGMADPYAGAFVAEDIARYLPGAPLRRLASVGHFPQLEAGRAVLDELAIAQKRIEAALQGA